jgi:hypothetical protein
MNGRLGVCGLEGSNIFVSSPHLPLQAQVFKFQKLSNSLISPIEDAQLISRL